MAFLFADGFDFYAGVVDASTRWDIATTSGNSLLTGTDTAFAAGQALSTYLANSGANYQKNWGSNEATLYFSIRLKCLAAFTGAATAGFALFLCDGATPQVTIRFNLDGSVTVYGGGASGSGSAGTLLASFPTAYSANTWDSWQGKVVISATAGSVELRKNGAPSDTCSVLGVNTRGGTANAYANTVQLGTGLTTGSFFGVDDLFLCSGSGAAPNAWLGDTRATQQLPAGAAQSQFAATGAASNWQAVAQLTEDGDSSYVASSTAGQEDVYTLAAMALPYAVVGVNYLACWKRSDAGARTGALSVAANGSADTTEISNASLSLSYAYSTAFLALDPTGAAWTPATVNGARLGIKVAT